MSKSKLQLFIALAVALCLAPIAFAQSGLVISTSTEATALNFSGAWYAADHTTETLDVLDWGAQKGNSLAVEGHELIASPTIGWNAYYGGVRITPDISKILSPTNISSDLFGVYAQGAIGVAGLSTGSSITSLVGGGAAYRMTDNLAWNTVDFRWLRVGAQNGYEISSGLAYYFNPSASKSLAVRRMMARKAAKAK